MKREILKVEPDYYGEQLMKGYWRLTLNCGHAALDKTREDCKKYPHKTAFCPTCPWHIKAKDI